MKKKALIVTTILVPSILFSVSVAIIHNNKGIPVIGDYQPYTLLLNNQQKITTSNVPSENEISNTVLTGYSNGITLSAYRIINNDSGWQTLLPGGYFYNPVSSSGFNNKISGITSILYTGNGSLELHYGYSINNQDILYSFENTLTPGVEFTFSEETPSYIYIKNVSGSNVNITNLSINYSCSAQTYPYNNLKVLMIGNSFADDTIFFGERIANSIGINIELYDAYIAGCTVDTHYSNIQSGSASYSMRSMNGSSWNYQNNMSLNDIVTYKDWDIITFQQASAEVGRPNKYSNLSSLVNEVKALVTGSPRYFWHQTWSYDQDYSEYYDYFSYFNNDSNTMFEALVDCYNDYVVPLGVFEKTIFNGTAVQNLRTSYMGDSFSRDGKHMSLIHGRYLLGSNFISSIYGIDFNLTEVNYVPEGMNRVFLKLVNESITNARKHPDVVTNSVYTETEIADYDLSNYTEIDAGLVGCSFYNSTDSSNYNKRINHTSGTSNIYATTYRFTQSTLPVGSLVFAQEGLGYRPEAWVNDAKQSSRKTEQYDNVLEITDEFWDGYQYRAFNLFKSGKQTLSGSDIDEQFHDIFDGFHIFVPNSKMGGLTPKSYNPYYSSDKTLFSSKGYDIDNYERVHLDPITGFYLCSEQYKLMNKYVDDTAQRFVCTRPFHTYLNDLPAGTILIVDSGYRWRSDCWTEKGVYADRPNNVTTNFTVLDSSFMSPFRRRTFNISTTSSSYVNQNSIEFMNHFRIYKAIA